MECCQLLKQGTGFYSTVSHTGKQLNTLSPKSFPYISYAPQFLSLTITWSFLPFILKEEDKKYSLLYAFSNYYKDLDQLFSLLQQNL